MYSNEREKEIMNLLRRNDYATVEYLAEKIHISQSSIRRDLQRLELKGMITRSYGGAELKESVNRQIPFALRSHKNMQEKAAVAAAAAELVRQGEVIFLDSSTSTFFMIDYLKSIKNITVISNSLETISRCAEFNISCYLAGGRINPENRSCCIGMQTEELIASFHADYCFFSVQSLTHGGILYDCFADEIGIRRAMIKNAEKSVFLCDSSKTGHYSAYKLCEVKDLEYIISDISMDDYLDGEYPEVKYIQAVPKL